MPRCRSFHSARLQRRPEQLHAVAVHATDVRAWVFRESGDPVEIADEPFRLGGACEVGVRDDERADGLRLDCQPLRRTVANLRVFHEYHPTLPSGVTEPLFVGEPLADALAVDVGHGVDRGAGGA